MHLIAFFYEAFNFFGSGSAESGYSDQIRLALYPPPLTTNKRDPLNRFGLLCLEIFL